MEKEWEGLRCERLEVSGAPFDKIYGNKIRDLDR